MHSDRFFELLTVFVCATPSSAFQLCHEVMRNEIATALAVLRSSPELNDEEIYRALVKTGIERRLAARLVEFLPTAYCRVILEPTSARFPHTFQRRGKDGTIIEQIPLVSEPVWVAALEFARGEIERGITRDQKLRVAGRSPEFQAT